MSVIIGPFLCLLPFVTSLRRHSATDVIMYCGNLAFLRRLTCSTKLQAKWRWQDLFRNARSVMPVMANFESLGIWQQWFAKLGVHITNMRECSMCEWCFLFCLDSRWSNSSVYFAYIVHLCELKISMKYGACHECRAMSEWQSMSQDHWIKIVYYCGQNRVPAF